MHFSIQYALVFVFAGFAAAAYFLRVGSSAKLIPIGALAVCALYTLATYGIPYAVLTIIEFATGFGIAHAVVVPDRTRTGRDGSNKDSQT